MLVDPEIKQQFIDLMAASKPMDQVNCELLLDTCVVGEIDTGGDLLTLAEALGTPEAALASPKYRYRQLRARHSIVLACWLAKNRVPTATVGGEVIDIVMGKLARTDDDASYALTTAIVHVMWEGPLRGWRRGALNDVRHTAEHGEVDDEILRVAERDKLIVVTWEGFGEQGLVANPKKLRDRCQAR